MAKRTVRPVTTTTALMDRVKEIHKLPSDYQLAKILGVTPAHVYNWRTGRSAPEPAIAVKIAELLNKPPIEILALIETQREETSTEPRPRVLELWGRYCPRLLPAIVAASIAAGGIAGRGTPVPFIGRPVTTLYIMRTLSRFGMSRRFARGKRDCELFSFESSQKVRNSRFSESSLRVWRAFGARTRRLWTPRHPAWLICVFRCRTC